MLMTGTSTSHLAKQPVIGDSVYSVRDLVHALRETGLSEGDLVLFQVSYSALGSLEFDASKGTICEWLYSAMREVVGAEGTIFLPAFSFSFARNEDFDLQSTPGVAGEWSRSLDFIEYFRQLPETIRSTDPIYSIAGSGPMAECLISSLPNTSLGKNCFYERLTQAGGKICGIGSALDGTPYLQYVEEVVGVPFKYRKLFTGRIGRDGSFGKQGWVANAPKQAYKSLSDGTRVAAIARTDGLCRTARIGRGEVFTVECKAFFDMVAREIARDPWITAPAPALELVEDENAASGEITGVELPANASMEEVILALWRLPRDIVSNGYDVALRALSTQVPMGIHEYPTGTECWTWIVPEKWTCREAWLETLDGRKIFAYADNPLHIVSYSLPIDREVSREELFEHLHVHQQLPDAIPFVFKYYERDWGLCCSKNLKESLHDAQYRVVIKSEFSYGTLKVGEVVVPGKSSDSFVLCAHLCHPGMVNDDLSGVVVGLKVVQELLKRKDLRYTYRFLILPEIIGSAAYLSHHEELIPGMVGGLFLEMLGLRYPHALQLSFAGDTEIDRCLTRTLKEFDPQGWTGPFRRVVGNDERQFNAAGVRVPMLSLSRVIQGNVGCWRYFPEYHSSADTPELASSERLAESRDLVLKMIDAVEGNEIPFNLYKGEIFCSRYGLNIDVYKNLEGNRALLDIIFLIDGTRSVAEIARTCGISIESARGVVEQLRQLGLVEYGYL